MFEERSSKSSSGAPSGAENIGPVLERVQEALRGLQYGEVTVTVQDGVAVQVERTDRVRLVGRDKRR